jgi:hypothetical protein
VILAVTIAAAGLVLYGGCLCLWHRATEPVNHELGEAANEPLKKAA